MTLEEVKQQLGEDCKVIEFKPNAHYLIIYNHNQIEHRTVREVGNFMNRAWGVEAIMVDSNDPASALRVLEIIGGQ